MDRYENLHSLIFSPNARWFFRLGALSFLLMAVMPERVRGHGEEASGLEGTWRLVIQSPSEGEVAVIEIKARDGRLAITRADHPLFRGINPIQAFLEQSERALVILMTNGHSDLVFKAELPGKSQTERIEGYIRLRLPDFAITPSSTGRLEKLPAYRRVERREPGQAAEHALGLGETLAAMAAARKAAAGFADLRYVQLDIKIAQDALKTLPIDAITGERVLAQVRLLDAARQAGKVELAREIEVQLDRLKRTLAEEKKPVSGPIKTEPYPGRSDPGHDHVVLLELFTGAECGPCVAADLAFDALSSAYQPSELITLEYHLHIPRPDPLASPDSVGRAAYYEVRSTPSTLFNGKPAALHGGGAEQARSKLNQYRSVIDAGLQATRGAKIELAVRKTGEQIWMTASAEVRSQEKSSPANLPRLRLVLVEDEVAYLGGNQQASHHHVVRQRFPGVSKARLSRTVRDESR